MVSARLPRLRWPPCPRPRVWIEIETAECILLCLRDGHYDNVADRLEPIVEAARLTAQLREARGR